MSRLIYGKPLYRITPSPQQTRGEVLRTLLESKAHDDMSGATYQGQNKCSTDMWWNQTWAEHFSVRKGLCTRKCGGLCFSWTQLPETQHMPNTSRELLWQKQTCDESLVHSTKKYPGRIIGIPTYKYSGGSPSKFLLLFFLSNHSFFESSQPRSKHFGLKHRVILATLIFENIYQIPEPESIHNSTCNHSCWERTCRPSRTQCPAQTKIQKWLPLWSTVRDWTSRWWIYRNWHEWRIRRVLASFMFGKTSGDFGKFRIMQLLFFRLQKSVLITFLD